MDFNHLDIEHKRHIALNQRAAFLAAVALEELSGVSGREWMDEIQQKATEDVDQLSDEQIEQVIQETEKGVAEQNSEPKIFYAVKSDS